MNENIKTADQFLEAWGMAEQQPWARAGLLHSLEKNLFGVVIYDVHVRLRILARLIEMLVVNLENSYSIQAQLLSRALRMICKEVGDGSFWYPDPNRDELILKTLSHEKVCTMPELEKGWAKREITAFLRNYLRECQKANPIILEGGLPRLPVPLTPINEWWFRAVVATKNADLLWKNGTGDKRAVPAIKKHLENYRKGVFPNDPDTVPGLHYFLRIGGEEAKLAIYLITDWAQPVKKLEDILV